MEAVGHQELHEEDEEEEEGLLKGNKEWSLSTGGNSSSDFVSVKSNLSIPRINVHSGDQPHQVPFQTHNIMRNKLSVMMF